jgi:hypothetical protein
MNRIIIQISGGLVQNVYTDSKDEFNIEVWDQDIIEDGGWLNEQEERDAMENDERLSAEAETLRPVY